MLFKYKTIIAITNQRPVDQLHFETHHQRQGSMIRFNIIQYDLLVIVAS